MPVTPEQFRDAARRFASGVTIVTVSSGQRVHGMTASSFAAVSLQPPLVLVNLERKSQTLALVHEVGSFAVNVLADHQREIARSFSFSGEKPFTSVDYERGTNGHPLLKGVLAWMDCTVTGVFDGGDHEVVLGEVLACASREGLPLVYWNRDYRGLEEA